jgi:hypothetical protein
MMNPGRILFVSVILLCISVTGCNHHPDPVGPPQRAAGAAENHGFLSPAAENPMLTVTNDYIDPIVSSTPNPFLVILDAPAGLPLEFCWTADGGAKNGKGLVYRYGWDIVDLNDPSLWAIEFTPLKKRGACSPLRTFHFGTHTLFVEVVDDSGNKSRVGIKLNMKPFPFYMDITPGSCPNSLNPKKRGVIEAAIPGTAGFDVQAIDISSLELWIDDNIVLPDKIWYADVTSPGIFMGDCDCCEGRPDSVDDLVLKFSAREVIQAIGPVLRGDEKIFYLRGWLHAGPDFAARGCMTIVGNHRTEAGGRIESNDISQ